MANNIPKRKVGRPRNAKVDSLAAELGLTPRRVRQLQASGDIVGTVSGNPTAPGATMASVRLRRATAEAARAELSLASETLEARRISGELMFASDGTRMCLAALESVAQAIRNGGHRYGQRANPEHPECGRRAVEAFVCEIGQLARAAIDKIGATPTPL